MFGIPFIRNVHNEQMRQKPRVVVPDRVNPPYRNGFACSYPKIRFLTFRKKLG